MLAVINKDKNNEIYLLVESIEKYSFNLKKNKHKK